MTVAVEPLGKTGEAEGEEELQRALTAPGQVEIALTPGTVQSFKVFAEGFWSAPETVLVSERQQSVTLKLWPAGVLKGKANSRDKGVELPDLLRLRFQSAGKEDSDWAVPESSVECPIEDGEWRCRVPAAELDLRLRAEGFISHYFWDRSIREDETLDLGALTFQRGASLTGIIETADGAPAAGCLVELLPRSAAPIPGSDRREKITRRSLKEAANKKGFFHFSGIAPGGYVIFAEKEGFVPIRRPVHQIYQGFEAELTETLVLQKPTSLDIFVNPPVGPKGRPWSILVLDARFLPSEMNQVAQGQASDSGFFAAEGLAPGRHQIAVLDQDGQGWYGKTIEVEQDSPAFHIEISLVAVRGTVSIGEQPLRARLHFGGRHGATSVEMSSDEEGEFAGVLSREGFWKVFIEAETPSVRRELNRIEVVRRSSSREAEVDIVLPDTILDGRTTDENGKSVSPAVVSVTSLGKKQDFFEPKVQTFVDEDGYFSFRGLGSGPLILQAEAPDQLSSDALHLSLMEDAEQPPYEIVLRKRRVVTGKVMYAGSAVPGAQVRAVVLREFHALPPGQVTDAAGEIKLVVSEKTREVVVQVMAAGFALKSTRVSLSQEPSFLVELDQLGGTLSFEIPTIDASDWSTPQPVLVHQGSFMTVNDLIQWSLVNREIPAEERRLKVPMMAPGNYSLCWARFPEIPRLLRSGMEPQKGCTSGYLPALGVLDLELSI